MSKCIKEYRLLTSTNPSNLNHQVNELLEKAIGWKLRGYHKVTTPNCHPRHTIYSQTMVRWAAMVE